ncbi:MAG: hypothetical protein H6670_01015 [Anaerolineaceae bacterium]|nr:hypothetical protein [Anaerolineaceae bacterium]
MEKSKRKQKRQSWPWWAKLGLAFFILIVIGGAAYFAFTLWAVNDVFRDTNFEWQGDEARSKAEELLDVTLPEPATDFRMHYTTWLDWFASIRFEIPAEVGTEWVSQMCFDELARNPGLSYIWPNDSLSWWQPEQAQDYLSGSCGNDPYYRILIDQTDPDHWIVYISANTT